MSRRWWLAGVLAGVLAEPSVAGASAGAAPTPRRLLMAHYMPWYEAKPVTGRWGWHWTMNRFDPERVAGGRPEAASQYRPLIGLYDSSDPDVLECHVLLMKLAGIDGVIFDWYGPDEHLDYGVIHRNCERLIPYLKRAGLRFSVCYEDQSVPRLIEGKRVDASEAIAHGQRVMRWLERHWFADPAYLRVDGRPLLMVFGPQHYRDEEWPQLVAPLTTRPMFLTLHHRRESADGAFDWPYPAEGLAAVEAFYTRSAAWPVKVPVAFPRFHDIYAEAGVHASYGHIPDGAGRTYETTLRRALRSGAPVVQVATWNDWGEGTMIEPSAEFGYRDLETTQRLSRRHLHGPPPYAPDDLRLPVRLFNLRKRHAGDAAMATRLEEAARHLFAGRPLRARWVLRRLEPTASGH